MASILKSKAIKNVTKGNTSAYYSYVEERNGTNPVIQQLEKELNDYMGFVKKKNSGLLKQGEHAPCKVSDALFDIWNKYEPRVTPRFFYQKLMQLGEFLVENREYSTASWQCYDRYLNLISNTNLEDIQSLEDLRHNYFPNGIEENSDMTFRALMGHCICMFHFTVGQDSKLQNINSIQQVAGIMKLLRLIMQLLFEVEHFCWLVYNATIYMYTIGRFMMQYGQSKIVLEYLLFCSLAMECSVVLLNVKYLSWRTTLYAATCQCYYDCKYNEDGERFKDGELFARRALSKINELHELEIASVTGENGVDMPKFREATIKIGAVLFKRLVFESRRKTKGILRPRARLTYKDLGNQTWPRTGVEKILYEMFDCSAAQFLAIEEALSETNRRIAMPGPAGGDNEPEMLDVALELLFAAEYLVNGGGGKAPLPNDQLSDLKALVFENRSQIAMAIDGDNAIHIKNLLKMIKLAYNYEAWDIFRRLSQKVLDLIQANQVLAETYKSEVQIIYLLQAGDKYLIHLRKLKHLRNEQIKANIAAAKDKAKKDVKNDDDENKNIPKSSKTSVAQGPEETGDTKKKSRAGGAKSSNQPVSKVEFLDGKETDIVDGEATSSPSASEVNKEEDLLSNIASKLIQIIDLNISSDQTDLDVVVDMTLLLWKKCKDIFQKYQTGSQDNYRWVTKLENFPKWLFILNVVHNSMCYFNISTIDPAVFAHCSLRLGLTYESLANVNYKRLMKDSASVVDTDDQYSLTRTNQTRLNFIELNDAANERFGASTDIRGNLIKAKEILKKSLNSIACARASVSRTDKTFLCDKDYDEDFISLGLQTKTNASTNAQKIGKLKSIKEKSFKYKKNVPTDSVSNLIADLHVELIFLHHKISVRLLEYRALKPGENTKEINIDRDFDVLLRDCKKNKISQSLLLLSKALNLANFNSTDHSKLKEEQKNLVEKAYNKLLKAQSEDKMLYDKHVNIDAKEPSRSKIPPAPVICLRTHTKIVVQPRNFESLDGTKASWYRIFASPSSSVNNKARISDYAYPGCGEQIPANNTEIVSITGLNPDEQYIFAVAAYDRNGNLIGDSIGDSTDPILACNTLSILMNWSYLCQVCYQIGEYDLALTAFYVMWEHFIIKPIEPEKETIVTKNEVDYEITFHQINYNKIEKTSPILIRKFLECIFIASDIQVKKKKIFCDLLFDGKIQYHSQIERIIECEKLLVAIEMAAWLNDAQIILQAIVQCYGLLAPLIYYNLSYEPIIQILSHCLLVLEELPASIFQKKAKNMFESLQHMIACSTFYLTDVLKRSNRKTMSNHFNLIGRKLLGMEEGIASLEPDEIETEETTETKPKKKIKEDKSTTNKQNEIKALEIHGAKANVPQVKGAGYFNMLTGNEEIAQIYAFISNNPSKNAYKELIKFRKRNNYFEILIYLMQKALNEELSQEITEWSIETIEWLQKRNSSILWPQGHPYKKVDPISTITTSKITELNSELTSQSNYTNRKTNRKRKIKKYKLLIPLDLDMNEKIKLEEKQKAAIDVLYDLIPDLYDSWTRRKKLRKMFQEEAAYKSQFYALIALNNFGLLMNRIQAASPQNKLNFLEKFYSTSYLDPGLFLFDKNNSLIINFDEVGLIVEAEKAESFSHKSKRSDNKQTNQIRAYVSKSPTKSFSTKSSTSSHEDKIYDIKDTCDLIADVMSGMEGYVPKDETNKTYDADQSRRIHITPSEFIELATNIFNRFKIATVLAYRGKQWTQLQNTCKLMFNCINSFMIMLPAITLNHRKLFRIKDLWKCLYQPMYIAAENLLDMIFQTCPIEKSTIRDFQNKINKWYDANTVGKSGASLKFDIPLDDINSIDLRFIKEFIFRTIQCLASFEKWEKTATIAMKFNAMTSYKFAEQLCPIISFSQHKLIEQVARIGENKTQPHLDRLRAELGRYPRIEDLFFINFKIEIDSTKMKKIEFGVKIDPKVHNIYPGDNKSKELISVPLDVSQTLSDLRDSLESSLYTSRALIHARRLLSLYLISQTTQTDYFGLNSENDSNQFLKSAFGTDQDISSGRVGFQKLETEKKRNIENLNEFFHSNPINLGKKYFKDQDEVFVKEIKIDLETIIESYSKAIQLLTAYKEFDLAIQAMHELGNVYHFSKNLEMAYKNWNEALDTLTGVKNSLINWRIEFSNPQTKDIDTERILKKCGIWGCLLGGVLTSKMAQYYLANDLELKTECCLFSATLFKCIFSSTIPYSKHEIDYIKEDLEFLNSDYLIPGLLFNSELHRFDIRYIIASLNFICLELLNAGHYLYIMPSLALYEYFAKMLSRDLTHTVLARLIKIEALTKLNFFNEAISMLNSIHKGENLPHFIDDKSKNFYTGPKFTDFIWNSSKPIYDLNNLKSLETVLSLKLPYNIMKAYGPHLTCKFYLVQCKLFIQIASCIPCLPNFDEFHSSQLYNFLESFVITVVDTSQSLKLQGLPKARQVQNNPTDDNPEVVKVFSKSTSPLTLQFIKGCLLGTCKTILAKCLKTFNDDFPKADKYFVSSSWQHEFKFECHMLLASISDQSQLGYLALQNVVEAMKELANDETQEIVNNKDNKKILVSAMKKNKLNAPKIMKPSKKGVYQMFDLISKSHLNSRLWLKARIIFAQYMFNQLNDAGKAKGADENIIRDFGDLKYYCEKSIEETDKFYDGESKAFFQFIDASLDLIRGSNLKNCLVKLEKCLLNYLKCNQLSLDGLIGYLKVAILKTDLSYTVNLLDSNEKDSTINLSQTFDKSLENLLNVQRVILNDLKTSGGEVIECYVDKKISYFDNIYKDIKNIYNPLLHYLVHVKLRLGSCMMLKSAYYDSLPEDEIGRATRSWQHTLNILSSGIELNKVICERSVYLEIELNYKYSHCVREMFMTRQIGTLADIVEAYSYTINLLNNSIHDLNLIKNCYLELAIAFISTFDAGIIPEYQSRQFMTRSVIPSTIASAAQTPVSSAKPSSKSKKLVGQASKAAEAALTALAYSIKTSIAIREKMLLSGHSSIKNMASINAINCPKFVSSDLLGYYVFAERKRVYRDEIEEEILSLAPEFEVKEGYKSYDDKIQLLTEESNKSITWIHILNYQSKLQNLNSMRNLNTLKNGKNRYKYSEFFTIGFAPILKSTHMMSSRLLGLNNYLKNNLPIYKNECQAQDPITEFFRLLAKKSTTASNVRTATATAPTAIKSLLEYVKVFSGNLASSLTCVNYAPVSDTESIRESLISSQSNKPNITINDWTNLQTWPANYDYNLTPGQQQVKANENLSYDAFADYMLTFNWYKNLAVIDDENSRNDDDLLGVIAIRDALTSNKIKFRSLSAEKILEIHDKLAPLATIADTAINSSKNTENDVNSEYLNSLRHCLGMIAKLFDKKFDPNDKKIPFELIASNIVDLERMFDINFGGFTYNESLKNYILNLFI